MNLRAVEEARFLADRLLFLRLPREMPDDPTFLSDGRSLVGVAVWVGVAGMSPMMIWE